MAPLKRVGTQLPPDLYAYRKTLAAARDVTGIELDETVWRFYQRNFPLSDEPGVNPNRTESNYQKKETP
jgi:hypothetical protein